MTATDRTWDQFVAILKPDDRLAFWTYVVKQNLGDPEHVDPEKLEELYQQWRASDVK